MSEIELLAYAARMARQHSDDTRTRNAAVIYHTGSWSMWAANTFPPGIARDGRIEPPQKYVYIEHAERAAIYECARLGFRTKGASMAVLWFACPDCARAIVMAGINQVIGVAALRQATPARWEHAVAQGEAILREAGVGLRWVTEPIGESVLFDGEEIDI